MEEECCGRICGCESRRGMDGVTQAGIVGKCGRDGGEGWDAGGWREGERSGWVGGLGAE